MGPSADIGDVVANAEQVNSQKSESKIPIKYISWDAAGVIIIQQPIQNWFAEKTGALWSPDQALIWNDYKAGMMTLNDFVNNICQLANYKGPKKLLANDLEVMCHSSPLAPAIQYVREMHTKGVLQGITSNHHADLLRPALRNHDIMHLFNPIIISSDVQTFKPHKKMWYTTLREVNKIYKTTIQPHECLHLDDLQRNVDGARESEIHSQLMPPRYTYDDLLKIIAPYEFISRNKF